jgi:small subunit ribosomal protein S35
MTIEDLDPDTRAEFDRSSPEDQHEMRQALSYLSKAEVKIDTAGQPLDDMDEEIARELADIARQVPRLSIRPKQLSKRDAGFWAEDEDDEFAKVRDDSADDFRADDITTPAHAQLDLHRDMREYQRRIAWDMPLLRSTFFSAPPFFFYSITTTTTTADPNCPHG